MNLKTVDIKNEQPITQDPESRGNILVVEDNPKNRKLVRSLLQINHFTVLEAGDAETGIKLAKSCRPDLILMDIQLPGMDGLEATRLLKDIPEIQEISIVALTSYAMEGDAEKATEAGCDGYLTKPIDTRNFIDYLTPFLPPDCGTVASRVDHDDSSAPKILIVDDEPLNLKLLRAKLGKNYPQIVDASNGQEALEKANEINPDLILLDIMMPGMDGFEVTRQLKANPKTKDIPIILITALDGHDYKVMGFEAGADEFLNKPINTFELLTRVKSLLKMKQYQEQLASADDYGKAVCGLEQPYGYSTFPNRKILLMLEDSEQRRQIQMYLFGQSYEISLKNDLENVAECIRKDPPDILIIDSQLRDKDYLGLFRTIKQNQNTGHCQVLYITTEEDLERNYSRIEDCVDDFLTEPINISELRTRIKVLLKKKIIIDKLFNFTANTIQQVITDERTGLYNFEYCKHVLKHETQRSIREHSKVSLLMMEVDDRLVSNSAAEHPSGDPLLRELSDLIKRSIRKLDIASHRAERTFAFVLPEANDEKTQGFIQRMIGLISSQLAAVKESEHPTDSLFIFGHAVCPDDSDQLDELIQKADAALEKNKISAKNSRATVDRAVNSWKKKSIANQTSRPTA